MSSNADMIKIVLERLNQEMAEHGLVLETIDDRIAALEGLREGWLEDPEESPEKSEWVIAVSFEIIRLQMKKLTDLLS